MNHLTVRVMTPEEVEWAMQLAAAEGWNPGLSDAGCFYPTDPRGFLIGLLGGKPVGCISAVSYSGLFGFIGLYIVLPEYRGKGYGIRLWESALARLEGHNIGLDGVPGQVPNYLKSGFRVAYNNIRFKGSGGVVSLETGSGNLVSLKSVAFEMVQKYDRRCFPAERTLFLKQWLKQPGTFSLGCLDSDCLRGYGVIRRCREGYKIGPLFADDAATAALILSNLVAKIGTNGPFFLDVPEPNTAALALAARFDMQPVFSTARMYTGGEPDIALNQVFGVTTFELG
jgi:GNAT superfamily N-acetyltransferase